MLPRNLRFAFAGLAASSVLTLLLSEPAHSQMGSEKTADPVSETRAAMLDIAHALESYRGSPPGIATTPLEHCIWSGLPFDRSARTVISHAELEALLVPLHLDVLPQFDAWGHAFEFQLEPNPVGSRVMAILSPGADGLFEASGSYAGTYTSSPDDDLVWADRVFVRQPPVPPEFFLEQAVEELRIVSHSLEVWHWDQLGVQLPPTTATEITLEPDFLVGHEQMLNNLIPIDFFFYTRCVPEKDPWGRNYDYYIHPNLLSEHNLAVRTAGADGLVEGATYDRRPVTTPEGDLVWADGVHFRERAIFADGFESGDTSVWSVVMEGEP